MLTSSQKYSYEWGEFTVNKLDSLEYSIYSFKVEFVGMKVDSSSYSFITYYLIYVPWEYNFVLCYLTLE